MSQLASACACCVIHIFLVFLHRRGTLYGLFCIIRRFCSSLSCEHIAKINELRHHAHLRHKMFYHLLCLRPRPSCKLYLPSIQPCSACMTTRICFASELQMIPSVHSACDHPYLSLQEPGYNCFICSEMNDNIVLYDYCLKDK